MLNFRNNSASCDNSISREITRPTLKVRTKLPASHHHSREESLHANSKATSVQAITREVVAFTVACITYNGSRPSLRTARPPISLTSNAESSTTPWAAAVIPPIDFNRADSTRPSASSPESAPLHLEPRAAAAAAPLPLLRPFPALLALAQALISGVVTSSTWSSFSGAPWSVYNHRHWIGIGAGSTSGATIWNCPGPKVGNCLTRSWSPPLSFSK